MRSGCILDTWGVETNNFILSIYQVQSTTLGSTGQWFPDVWILQKFKHFLLNKRDWKRLK